MTRRAPRDDHDEGALEVHGPESWATGIPAVVSTLRRAHEETSPLTALRGLLKINHTDGFDCPGCAWPDPHHRKIAEFCENGAKHFAVEATARRLDAEFFDTHSISDLGTRSDWWLEEQGRLTQPLIKTEGSDHYRPIGWEEALDIVATELRALEDPDQAVFYTSGRASNEAAFVYQLFARAYGTNNLPDCSNMCHESTGVALGDAIGIGKGSCTLDDLETAELILLCGQNPGTNHPRMLTHLELAKKAGARIVAVNPLPEAGLLRFKNPQSPISSLGSGTAIADDYFPVRLAGDQALFLGIGKTLLADHPECLDQDFIDRHTTGFEQYQAHATAAEWSDIESSSGMTRQDISRIANLFSRSRSTVVCWAMGLTQHRNSVASIKEVTNVLFLQGNIGKRGAGVFPVRGHSNVQGDRTMGIWEQMPDEFLTALGTEFGFEPPRDHGLDAVDSVKAMRDGRVKAFVALGGNLVRAVSDSSVAETAMRSLRLTVSIATKLNRSHTVVGDVALVLPTMGRTERDPAGAVTVEDSVGQVHASRGHRPAPAPDVRSETAIIAGLAERVLAGKVAIDWAALAADYDVVRDHISRVVPGFEHFNDRVSVPEGFLLPHPPRDTRTFPTSDGRAHFSVNALEVLRLAPGRLLMQTIRSHDQFNTSVYSYNDRYRGIHGGRRIVLVNPADAARLGLGDGDRVAVVAEWADGIDRRMEDVRVVTYPTALDCCAMYYPEANILIPLDSVAAGSNTPTSKSVVVRLDRKDPSPTGSVQPSRSIHR